MLRGRLDCATRRRISGWAQDERLPHQPVALLILDNDVLLDRVVANRHRADLAAGGIGDGRHGFDIQFSGGLPGLGRHVVRVIGERDGTELAASPALIGADDAFGDDANASLQTMLDGLADDAAIDAAIRCLSGQIERLATRRTAPPPPAPQQRQALIIDGTMPRRGHDSGSNAILSHAESLVRLGFEVAFAAADGTGPALDHPTIQWRGPPLYRSVEEILRREANRFGLVYLHRLDAAACYMPLVRFHQTRARIIYSLADLHHVRLARRGFAEREPHLVAQARKVRETELAVAGAADIVLTHSHAEAAILRRTIPPERVLVAPWAVPGAVPIARPRRHAQNPIIGFIGHFGHAPNIAAARRLAFRIMPRLRAIDPTITCLIAGSAMPSAMRDWSAPGVEPLGEIDDLPGFFARLSLTVAPMSFGAGIKGKLLDSMEAGIPCIASPVAIEGLDWPRCLASCIATTDDDFVAAILALRADPAARRRAAAAGRAFIGRNWSAARVDAVLGRAVGMQALIAPA